MQPTSVTFRRSAARGWGFVRLGLFPIFGAVFFTTLSFGSKDEGLLTYLPLVMFGVPGLLLIGMGLGQVADRSPKLSADAVGLVNHMTPGGGRLMPWGTIQSLDCSVDPFDRSGNMGQMVVYHRSEGGGVTKEAIDLTGLDGGPLFVFTEVKRLWLQVTPPTGPEGSGASPPRPPGEPGAAPPGGA
jgi:hypothetical protein